MSNLKWLKVLILFIIVFALQMTVADWLSFFDVGPDFVIIFIHRLCDLKIQHRRPHLMALDDPGNALGKSRLHALDK